jgi:hypothetical protein
VVRREGPAAGRDEQGAQPGGIWLNAFDELIAAGHRHADIMGYTWLQFTSYRDAAARRHAQAQHEALTIALAASAGGKHAASLMAAFSGMAQG